METGVDLSLPIKKQKKTPQIKLLLTLSKQFFNFPIYELSPHIHEETSLVARLSNQYRNYKIAYIYTLEGSLTLCVILDFYTMFNHQLRIWTLGYVRIFECSPCNKNAPLSA